MSASIPNCPVGHRLLAGKTVVVTAAAGTGIGFATAKRCLEEGAHVVVSDRHERRLEESRAELGAQAAAAGGGQSLTAFPCDVTVEASVQALVDGSAAWSPSGG